MALPRLVRELKSKSKRTVIFDVLVQSKQNIPRGTILVFIALETSHHGRFGRTANIDRRNLAGPQDVRSEVEIRWPKVPSADSMTLYQSSHTPTMVHGQEKHAESLYFALNGAQRTGFSSRSRTAANRVRPPCWSTRMVYSPRKQNGVT